MSQGNVRLGFAGLGIMGTGMALNLYSAGFDLTVWNRSPAKATPFASLGVPVAPSVEQLAESVDVLFICLSDTPDVEVVGRAVLGVMRAGSILVDHSTISPSATRELAAEAAEHGVTWIDAPVSGGNEGAENGTLAIMVGGPEDAVEAISPYLDVMGSSTVRMGPAGTGQTTKLANQILCVVNQLASSEALLLAEQAGLDLHKVIEAVGGGAAGSWMLANRGPQMADGYWGPGFTIDLQQKDLRLVMEEAGRLGVPLQGTELVQSLYSSLQAEGLGGDGNHALVKAVARLVPESKLR